MYNKPKANEKTEVTKMHAPYVLYGVTALAAGIAKSLADRGVDSLIIDRGSLPAAEFAEAMRSVTPICSYSPTIDASKELLAELVERDISADCGDSLPTLEPVFCSLLAKLHDKVGMLAGASVISEERTADGKLRLEVYTIGGIVEVITDCVIDTTSTGRIVSRTLNANIALKGDIPEGIDMVQGRFGDEKFLRLRLDDGIAFDNFSDAYIAARSKMLDFWRNRPESLRDAGLVHIADRFDDTCEAGLKKLSDGRYSLASTAFGNALEAFDFGVKFGAELEVNLK